MSISLSWELNSLYSSEDDFNRDLARVEKLFSAQEDLKKAILNLQEGKKVLQELSSYAECLVAQDPADPKGHAKEAEASRLEEMAEAAGFQLGLRLGELSEEAFSQLLTDSDLEGITFYVQELHDLAKCKGPKECEEVISALTCDGYHSLWALYQTITGKIRVGKEKLSIGQADNLLSSPDRKVREQTFADWTEAWKGEADLLAQLLNNIGGFRLGMYEIRGWEDPLYEPLLLNRMERKTLDAMWDEVVKAKPVFLEYLAHKARLLGVDKLSWVDLEVPLVKTREVPFEKGAALVMEEFEKFHPKMAEFTKKALENRWIEAEDRPGKAAGGFCVALPASGESRIFMTYKGTQENVVVLAHELGHAYHNECLKDLPYFSQQAQMNVAETASTFAEMIVIDQSIQLAQDPQEKLQLLDDKLQRAVSYFLNLHARLLFEEAFYAERKKGFVSAERLCELMESAQREAFGDSLSSYFPYFWGAKLHFFYTRFPFYNFPYTFGYLLSNGLYARAKGGKFGDKFDAFLQDTGRMQVEDLAQKHLGVDLREPAFWRESVQVLVDDVRQFKEL